mmetsp:Transcript_55263/g.66552  ORF Transcript_55263/g.66552 Transcript_55263/m.66552 type:complete len:88 (-) Transcript_55263:79-342(-)
MPGRVFSTVFFVHVQAQGSLDPILNCDPCIDRKKYTTKAIVHGNTEDEFWQHGRTVALQSDRDMRVDLSSLPKFIKKPYGDGLRARN